MNEELMKEFYQEKLYYKNLIQEGGSQGEFDSHLANICFLRKLLRKEAVGLG